jgi:hypothetical protein
MGSPLACRHLQEAVVEIKKVAKMDRVTLGGGVVIFMERVWPALQHIDISFGTLASSVHWALEELLPNAISAPVDRKTRDGWLARLWQAIKEDDVDYLSLVGDHWGEL